MMIVNNWDKDEVSRAETGWGSKLRPWAADMFNFAFSHGSSYLDLGCGFGRFLDYCITNSESKEPDYIGYDSSPAMIARSKEHHPEFFPRLFLRSVTTPITHMQESVLLSSVLIHLVIKDQNKVISNLTKMDKKPLAICFDINCPNKRENARGQKVIDTINKRGFIETWQSHDVMESKLKKLFPDYSLTSNKYPTRRNNRSKTVFFLEKN